MKEKLSLLTELIKLARKDQQLRDQEYQFLHTISKSLDVPKEEFDRLFQEYIEFTPPESSFDRFLQLQRLVLLMNVDHEVIEQEVEFIKDVAIRMGISPATTELILEEMHNYPNNAIPTERLIEIFKSQFN